MRIYHT